MGTAARSDPFTFYALSMLSFLESAVPNYVQNLQPFFGDDPDGFKWLRDTWLPEESAHGRIMRTFVEHQWPEFCWETGYAEFLRAYVPRCSHDLLRPSRGLEALARCVTETEAAMVYRCIAAYTTDAELRMILEAMSRDETRHYAYFRDLFDRYDAVERNSIWKKAQTVLERSELVRDEDIALAFAPLNDAWRALPPFRRLSYAEFMAKAACVMSRYFPIEAAKRMLFRPLATGRIGEKLLIGALALLVRKQYGIGFALG